MTILENGPAGAVHLAEVVHAAPEDGLLSHLRTLQQEELLDALAAAVHEHQVANRAGNTVLSYAKDWAAWAMFCQTLGVEPETVNSALFYTYVEHLIARELAVSTVGRMLAGAIVSLRDRGHAIPDKGGPGHEAWKRVRKYADDLEAADIKRGRGQAVAVTTVHVAIICRLLPMHNLYGLRDKAIMLIGLAIASRRSELANLLDTDIAADPKGRGLEVRVRASKGGKTRTVAVPYSPHERHCPVRAWLAWREAAAIDGGPAFRRIYGRRDLASARLRVGEQGLGGQTMNAVVKELGHLADVDLDLVGHSLRAGRVTIAFDQNHDVGSICEITGHSPKSGTVYDYRRPMDRWNNSANVLGF